jgi:hypothetical protein
MRITPRESLEEEFKRWLGVGEHASRAAARGRVLECVAVWRYWPALAG